MRRVLLAIFSALLLVILMGQNSAAIVRQEPANLLQNAGFEGEFFSWFGINEVQVAHSWTPWWRARNESDPPATYFQPEFKQANGYIFPDRVHGGASAQQWFTFHATHHAGMYQQVFGVTPGVRYRFTIWAQVWSSTADDAHISVNPAYPNLRVGVDPTGNWDPWAGSVVWSGTYAYYDTWGQLAVEVVAQNNVVTVFMRSEPNFPVKHNDMYWDDAVLIAVGEGVAPHPPTATSVAPPFATATSVAPPPPTPTCAPPPSDWVTYYIRRGDTLFSLAKRTDTTLEKVISFNCLRTTTIYVGQALLLPKIPPTLTPSPEVGTATPVPATATPVPVTATAQPTETPTPRVTAAPTETPTAVPPTAVPPTATATSAPVIAASATPTRPRPTIPPPATSTPGALVPPPTSTPLEDSGRPCGTIAVGGGIVLLAGVFRVGRRRKSVDG